MSVGTAKLRTYCSNYGVHGAIRIGNELRYRVEGGFDTSAEKTIGGNSTVRCLGELNVVIRTQLVAEVFPIKPMGSSGAKG